MGTINNQLELKLRVNRWKESFANTALTSEDIDELSGHLTNVYNEMLALGLSDQEAWMVATNRVGKPEALHEEFKKVNSDFSLNRNWMLLLWGAVSLLILQAIFIVLPLLYSGTLSDKLKTANESQFITGSYYAISIILVVLFIFAIARSGSIISRFTSSLTKYASIYAIVAVVAGLWAAFFSYILFANYMASDGGEYTEERRSLSFLMFGFYFPLIALTAFATLRYFSSEITSFKVFNKSINWKRALIIGLIAQTPIQFSHAFPGDDNTRAGIVILVSLVLFLIIGWMISYSPNGISSLIAAQVAPMGIFIMGVIVNEQARLLFFVFYVVKLIALAAGYYFNKRKLMQAAY